MIILSGAGGEGPGVSPGPELWLKADAIEGLNDGDALTTWEDSSTNGNDATQSTAGNKPTYRTNQLGEHPSVYFSQAGTDFMSLGSAIGTGDVTVFVVCRFVGDVNQPAIVILGGPAGGLQYDILGSASPFQAGATGNVHTASINTRFTIWQQANFTKSGNTVTQRLNGVDAGNGSTGSSANGFDTIGALPVPSSYFDGFISEIIVYDRVLSGAEILTVEDYLEDKYSIADTRQLWLQADAITGKVNDDSVTNWLDVSGKGNHFSSSGFTAPIYKTNVQNSLPGLRFGSGVGMQTPGGVTYSYLDLRATPYTIYVVYNYRSATSAGRRALQGRANNWLIGPYSNIHRCFSGGFSTGLTVVQDAFVIQWVVGSGSNNTNNVNGTGYTSGGSDAVSGIALGVAGQFAEILDGDILEIIIESRADDSTQQGVVKNYLAAKYNITVV